jgi:hypothetical protein
MKRWRTIVISAVATIALVSLLVFVFWPREREPRYDGKKLRDWLELTSNAQEQQRAQKAIQEIGTNALPWLLKWIKHEPWHFKKHGSLIALLPAPLRDRISATGWDQTALATKGFEVLGSQASPAIPGLVTIVRGEQMGAAFVAVEALVDIGEPAIPALQKVIADPQWLLRRNAVMVIGNAGRLGTNELAAINLLITALHDSKKQVAFSAATMLKRFSDRPELVVPELVRFLNSSDSELQIAAIRSLGHFGKKAESAAPILALKLEVPDHRIRWEATNALSRIAPETLTNGVSAKHD